MRFPSLCICLGSGGSLMSLVASSDRLCSTDTVASHLTKLPSGSGAQQARTRDGPCPPRPKARAHLPGLWVPALWRWLSLKKRGRMNDSRAQSCRLSWDLKETQTGVAWQRVPGEASWHLKAETQVQGESVSIGGSQGQKHTERHSQN